MEINNRKSICANLKYFSPIYNEHDYIEITEWANEEGWDIDINGKEHIQLHMDALDAINFLVNYLRYEDKIKHN